MSPARERERLRVTAAPVQTVPSFREPLELLDLFDALFGAPPYKRPARGLRLGCALDNATVRSANLPKNAGHHRCAHALCPRGHGLCVLLRGNVHDYVRAGAEDGV